MTDCRTPELFRHEALIVGRQGLGGGVDALARLGRDIGAEKRRQQLAIDASG